MSWAFLVITNVVLERHYGAQQLACNDKFHSDHQSQCSVFYKLQQYYDDFYECCSLVVVEPQLSGVMSAILWNSCLVVCKICQKINLWGLIFFLSSCLINFNHRGRIILKVAKLYFTNHFIFKVLD